MLTKIRNIIRKLRKKSKNLYRSGWQTDHEVGNTMFQSTGSGVVHFDEAYTRDDNGSGGSQKSNVDTRVMKKPVEIVGEIVGEQPKMVLEDLGRQIKIVKRRISILEEQSINAVDEKEALGYLQARKKFKKYSSKFGWAITTQKKVDELCKKYKVMSVSFNNFYKNVPNEALDELEKFNDAWEYIKEELPTLSLIVDQGGKEDKKDPILLAKSPFGRWFYILGAWDKEVEIVDDLIYNGK